MVNLGCFRLKVHPFSRSLHVRVTAASAGKSGTTHFLPSWVVLAVKCHLFVVKVENRFIFKLICLEVKIMLGSVLKSV